MDIALLRKSVEWAEAEAALPVKNSAWCQRDWVTPGEAIGRDCGTAYCVAGYILHITGNEPTVSGLSTGLRAAELLGVRLDQVLWNSGGSGLFGSINTIKDVRREAELLATKYGEVL